MRERIECCRADVLAAIAAACLRVRETLRGALRIPDYEAYLAHFRARHPGEPPLDRGAFLANALERRHAGRGARCC